MFAATSPPLPVIAAACLNLFTGRTIGPTSSKYCSSSGKSSALTLDKLGVGLRRFNGAMLFAPGGVLALGMLRTGRGADIEN